MKINIYCILFVLCMAALFAPLLQSLTQWPKCEALQGVVAEQPMPKPTLQSCRDGSFQTGTEKYLQYHFGFRPPVIRLYNQYLWDFYGKTYVSPTTLTIGKDGWLYEPWFVEDYYQSLSYNFSSGPAAMAEMFKAEAKRVFQLQHILHDCGTTLMVALLPGKDLIYPEHLPDNKTYTKEKKITARGFFGPEYDRLGVNHVDVEQWFVQMKDTADFLLFPQTGTHWSNLAAMYVADSLFRHMEKLKGCNMHNIIIGKPYMGEVRRPDNDLENLLNLVRPLKRLPLHYANIEADNDTTAIKPRLLTVGDSFWWNIASQVPMNNLFSACPFWYYNSKVYDDNQTMPVNDFDVVKELLSADFVLISYCSAQLYNLHNDFTKHALIACCYDSEEIDSVRNKLRNDIVGDKEWLSGIEKHAKEKGQELEPTIEGAIDYMINLHPERYFPALADSIPSKRSQHFVEVLQQKNIHENSIDPQSE